MKLNDAEKISMEIVGKLIPYCKKIEVAGSIRRRRPEVHDIDIVIIPSDFWNLDMVIANISRPGLQKNGEEYKMFHYKGVQIDLYFATEASWYTKLLIRTGSKENNIRLAAKAKSMGYHLHANGMGLFDSHGARIAGDSEESIYEKLNLMWQEPHEREV